MTLTHTQSIKITFNFNRLTMALHLHFISLMEEKINQKLTPMEIESRFDSEEIDQITDSQWIPLQKEFFQTFENNDLVRCLNICEQIFFNESHSLTKVFALQWAIVITEIIYDLEQRQKWFSRWNQIKGWTGSFWCRYLYKDQQALHFYFQGSLTDAQKLFEQNLLEAEKENYQRGQMRTLFHLALISKNQNKIDMAIDLFNKSLLIAKRNNAIRFIQRIEGQLSQIEKATCNYENHTALFENYLKVKNYKAAKKLALYLCRVRRIENRNWEAKSEYLYLCTVTYCFSQMNRFYFIYNKIKDSVVKKQILFIANSIRPLNESLMFEYKTLCDVLNANNNIEYKQDEVIYHGINFGSPNLSETAALIKALTLNPQGIDKETLCKTLWKNSDYDPTYHDQKIYRLISKIRKQAGKSNIISNHYNFYKLG